MKKFNNTNELYVKVLGLFGDVEDLLVDYIKEQGVTVDNYKEKLDVNMEEVLQDIFNKILGRSNTGIDYILNNTENEDGDMQIISAFIKGYIADKVMDEILDFEEENEEVDWVERERAPN